jgi:hypothetical protein
VCDREVSGRRDFFVEPNSSSATRWFTPTCRFRFGFSASPGSARRLSRGTFTRNHAGSHLLESELFDHESRAFTCAQRENWGRFGIFRREVPGPIQEPGRRAAGGVLADFSRCHWPGTVRQLENVIKTVSASP